ncbi:unnamed protein product [Cunninghamella echinulata]
MTLLSDSIKRESIISTLSKASSNSSTSYSRKGTNKYFQCMPSDDEDDDEDDFEDEDEDEDDDNQVLYSIDVNKKKFNQLQHVNPSNNPIKQYQRHSIGALKTSPPLLPIQHRKLSCPSPSHNDVIRSSSGVLNPQRKSVSSGMELMLAREQYLEQQKNHQKSKKKLNPSKAPIGGLLAKLPQQGLLNISFQHQHMIQQQQQNIVHHHHQQQQQQFILQQQYQQQQFLLQQQQQHFLKQNSPHYQQQQQQQPFILLSHPTNQHYYPSTH